MRVLLVTDAWLPQVNGVVRTLQHVVRELGDAGHVIEVVHPGLFRTVPCPTYPEIRLALFPGRALRRIADELVPDAVHVATEGPLGLAARNLCVARGWAFTTSFHTRFPEYVRERAPIPLGFSYRVVRWFHGKAERMLVPTARLRDELRARGFANAVAWTRGVDVETFRPERREELGLPGPVFAYVGRLAVEKNVSAFLELDLPGTKLVVGDGPARAELERRFPDAVFVGMRFGDELARTYASADVFVFPSRTDTFGLVLLEALASGTPVAAFPVAGPADVIGDAPVGVLDEDLGSACRRAVSIPRADCRAFALGFSWRRCAELFFESLAAGTSAPSAEALEPGRPPTRLPAPCAPEREAPDLPPTGEGVSSA